MVQYCLAVIGKLRRNKAREGKYSHPNQKCTGTVGSVNGYSGCIVAEVAYRDGGGGLRLNQRGAKQGGQQKNEEKA